MSFGSSEAALGGAALGTDALSMISSLEAATQEALRLLLEKLPCGVLVADSAGRVRIVNERLYAHFDSTGSAVELIGRPSDAVFRKLATRFEDPESFLALTCPLRDITRSVASRELSFADGRTILLEYATLDTADGIHHVWIFHGISDTRQTQQRLAHSNLLLSRVTAAFSHYVAGEDPRNLFDGLLSDALALTESDYGFIGRVLIKADGTPYLKTYSITNIAWNDETRELYERHHRQGMEFHNLDTLFGRVIATGEPVISNAPSEDPRRGGLPHGHPPLDAFLGIPLVSGDRLVGMLGVANRPGGYDRDLLEFLEPFLLACANIINAELADQLRQESEKRYSELYRNLNDVFTLSPDGFVSIDHDDRILMVSPGFTTLTGIQVDTVIGQHLSVLDEKFAECRDSTDGSASFCEVLAEPPCKQDVDEPTGDTLSLRFPRTRVLKRLVRCSDSEDSEVKAIICLRDITLETEVNRMKSEFLSTAAHELRTPMASVYGFSELLLTREFDAASSREFLETIHAQSGRLIEMLNELLDLARIEARVGKDFEMEPGDIRPLLRTAVREITPTAGSRAVTLDMADDLPAARFDQDKLMQVLTNVLSNAVKYSSDDSSIDVRAECRPCDASQAWIAVAIEDDGIGMTEEEVRRICERFYRADPSGAVPGSGLGMSLVREIIDIHGGKIEIGSSPRVGTTVTILLPTVDLSTPAARADNL